MSRFVVKWRDPKTGESGTAYEREGLRYATRELADRSVKAWEAAKPNIKFWVEEIGVEQRGAA